MKKCEFYTLVRIRGEIQAVKVFGYTDGKYMYYNTNHHCNVIAKARNNNGWFCIHPETGLSIPAPRTTRKAAQSVANSEEMQSKIADYMQRHGHWWRRKFAEYIQKYEEGMVWKNETA